MTAYAGTRVLPTKQPIATSIHTSAGRPRTDGGRRRGRAHLVVEWWPGGHHFIATRCSLQQSSPSPAYWAMRGSRVLEWPLADEVTCKNCLRCGPVEGH